ncbi:MAG: hypothetical protein V1860_01980 [bacterium]
MKNITIKKIASGFLILAVLAFAACPIFYASAQIAPVDGDPNVWGVGEGGAKAGYVTDTTNLGERDPRTTAAAIINILLGFLGIIAVIIILIGGFKWMTAGGNEDQVGEAKKWIFSGIIGLLIILASYALADFAIKQLIKATATSAL